MLGGAKSGVVAINLSPKGGAYNGALKSEK